MLKWKAFTKLFSYYWTTVGQTAAIPIIGGDLNASIGSLAAWLKMMIYLGPGV